MRIPDPESHFSVVKEGQRVCLLNSERKRLEPAVTFRRILELARCKNCKAKIDTNPCRSAYLLNSLDNPFSPISHFGRLDLRWAEAIRKLKRASRLVLALRDAYETTLEIESCTELNNSRCVVGGRHTPEVIAVYIQPACSGRTVCRCCSEERNLLVQHIECFHSQL